MKIISMAAIELIKPIKDVSKFKILQEKYLKNYKYETFIVDPL
ncbi:hypothetical protein [Pantoea sp. Nvir]|nr:hypothetical protein [Pantoea sp. Nvir]